jgi:hypothetical protein
LPAARDERATHASSVANAPSSPQWSFGAEPPSPVEARVNRPPEPQAKISHSEVEQPKAEPLPEAAPPAEKKGGWWQRRFKNSG